MIHRIAPLERVEKAVSAWCVDRVPPDSGLEVKNIGERRANEVPRLTRGKARGQREIVWNQDGESGIKDSDFEVVANGTTVATRDVAENSVVGGVPAKRICGLDELVERMKRSAADLPWAKLIEKRAGGFDAALQPILDDMRIKHFFVEDADENANVLASGVAGVVRI